MALNALRENDDDNTVSFVIQHQVDLAWYLVKSKLPTTRTHFVVFCHAEEEITVCQIITIYCP
jgi:hypothetical protein